MDVEGIILVEVFKISIDILSGSENVDISILNFPGTSSASAFWHNFIEVVPLFTSGGFDNAFLVATKLRGSSNEEISEKFVHLFNSLHVFSPCNLKFTGGLFVLSFVGISNCMHGI